jgi:hypothetical protein
VPGAAVEYVAGLVGVEPGLFGKYPWTSRTVEYHRAQIRAAFGSWPATEADEQQWAG